MTERKSKLSAQAPQVGNNNIAIDKIEVGGDVSGTILIGNTEYAVEKVSVLDHTDQNYFSTQAL